ncbi:MAG TPA: YggS family pyridoxal phosphate-dependent enzyme [Balneola sp.]|jgi:PLP dependent protein|nr:YggS family pyridoxal phosphate-dependent enzyme [Balneola sp.]MAO76378.1 YggS family pyridoxal phosphate-dependent enzyme [Balneola sp.]MBF65569.1 YggS family pyridoxal phosphate-dependent enzyme [Balneola sp.]HAH51703.1 YggS family pyridoxal phosphate-dependent enzyme [Balneola sp.]HAW79810.1 YggS family pyridoxal phosphate-dependent enzyme [Balneola sp.]|tara:strand:- start:2052 stop:2750 length:699 start_codon:yes stop_codon:yes gene_type:complete
MEKSQICENIRKVKSKIEKTCRKIGRETSEVTLVAVSKTKPASYIREALECGQIEFGENRMQELEEKIPQFEPAQVSWHMIGNIQTNKIKLIADKISWVHSIEKLKYLKEFEKRSNGNKIKALIQVNISGEKQKGGVEPEDLAEILKSSTDFEHVKVCGLMGMATFVDDPEDVRHEFKLLKNLFDDHQKFNSGSVNLRELSMGMSNDLEVAIEEGATMVRVGSEIFGARNYD